MSWFSRNFGKIKTALNVALKIAGASSVVLYVANFAVSLATELIEDNQDSFWKDVKDALFAGVPTEYEPTPQEDYILKDFINNKISFYTAELYIKVNDILLLDSVDQQIIEINKILKDKEILLTYFKTNDVEGLSLEAIDLRNQIIAFMFIALDLLVKNIFENNSMVYKLKTTRFVVKSLKIEDYYPIVLTIKRPFTVYVPSITNFSFIDQDFVSGSNFELVDENKMFQQRRMTPKQY